MPPDLLTNEGMTPRSGLISPEVQVMVDVTRANTEQLVKVNQYLATMTTDMQYLRKYFDGTDGLQKDLDVKFREHTGWLWLKISGSMTIVVALLTVLAQLLNQRPAAVPGVP